MFKLVYSIIVYLGIILVHKRVIHEDGVIAFGHMNTLSLTHCILGRVETHAQNNIILLMVSTYH